jgi:hypothetical protein
MDLGQTYHINAGGRRGLLGYLPTRNDPSSTARDPGRVSSEQAALLEGSTGSGAKTSGRVCGLTKTDL